MKTEFYKHIELDSELLDIKALLESNNIRYEVTSADVIIDKAIVGTSMFPKYTLKLLPTDFKAVNQLIREYNESKQIAIEDFEHLTALSNEELFEILEKPQEWTGETEIVARKILKKRDVDISDRKILEIRKQKQLELRKGKSVPIAIQLLYFVAIVAGFYLSILFMIAGIGMGFYYTYGKATDNEGEKYFVYDERARKIGGMILYGGLICFAIQLYILFFLVTT